jgi:hypothetical protein
MNTKKWYLSKTIWVNLILLVASIINSYDADININAADQVIILSAVNIILRFITKEQITW